MTETEQGLYGRIEQLHGMLIESERKVQLKDRHLKMSYQAYEELRVRCQKEHEIVSNMQANWKTTPKYKMIRQNARLRNIIHHLIKTTGTEVDLTQFPNPEHPDDDRKQALIVSLEKKIINQKKEIKNVISDRDQWTKIYKAEYRVSMERLRELENLKDQIAGVDKQYIKIENDYCDCAGFNPCGCRRMKQAPHCYNCPKRLTPENIQRWMEQEREDNVDQN